MGGTVGVIYLENLASQGGTWTVLSTASTLVEQTTWTQDSFS